MRGLDGSQADTPVLLPSALTGPALPCHSSTLRPIPCVVAALTGS